jgi:quinol monooxygenase YgiN
MAIILVHFKVEDKAKWRSTFEEHASLRQSAGCTGTHIFYNAQDPNDIFINMQWDTPENFQKAMSSPEIQKAMAESGMIGAPDFWMLEDGGRTAG